MRFSDEFLAEVRARNDIVDVISPYVDLRVRGPRATGLCPFHNEKSPSFTVFTENQSFYCFGCGAGGDVITFIKTIESLDYTEAVKMLAERSGLALPMDGYDDSVAKLRRRILDANREAAKFFYNCLFTPQGKAGLDYFTNRKLSLDTIRHFGLGFAPDSWDSLIRYMKSKGYSEAELLSADLARKTQNGHVIDVFRNRAMFPIIDVRGSVIAFGGRVLDDSKPKYVNTSDTLVYKKSQGVFALNFAKRGTGKTLILCEGYMDVIAYHQAGFTNAVAGLGTAFTQEQAKLLSKYAEEIILSYDSDEAGQKATRKAIGILSKTPLRIRVARLADGKDPDEIIKTFGKEKMLNILNNAVGDIEFDLTRAKQGYDITTSDGKVAYLNSAVEILSSFRNPIQWDVYASKLAEELGVSKEAIVTQITKQSKNRVRRNDKAKFASAATFNNEAIKSVNPERQRHLRAAIAEETLISSLLHNPDFYLKIKDSVMDEDFSTQLNLRIYRIIETRLEEKRSVELTYFADELTAEEMGYLAMLESKRGTLGNTVKECLDCIRVMREEKKEQGRINPANTTSEEFLELFRDLNKKD